MGVEPARLLVMPIGSWAAEHLSPNSDRAPAEGEGPVRLLFLGFHTYAKGLAVLVDALGLLTRAWRGRVHLAAFGAGVPAIAPRIAPIRDSLAGVELGGAYDRADVPRLVAGRHFGVVPSVWWDNGPQSAIEMRSLGLPVIGAAIGGIPDIIEDGREGLLFRANDRHDLARVLAGVIREPGLSARVRARMRPWPTMGEHAGALASVYAEALSSRRGVGSEGRG
jgi:glycosyltransferase involved in cell wall biosynthesis